MEELKKLKKAGRPFGTNFTDAKINIRVKSDIFNKFKDICEKQNVNYSKVIRSLIEEYVNENKDILVEHIEEN